MTDIRMQVSKGTKYIVRTDVLYFLPDADRAADTGVGAITTARGQEEEEDEVVMA